jgi:hypothetical protein
MGEAIRNSQFVFIQNGYGPGTCSKDALISSSEMERASDCLLTPNFSDNS